MIFHALDLGHRVTGAWESSRMEFIADCGVYQYEVLYGRRSKRHRRSRFGGFTKLARDQEW